MQRHSSILQSLLFIVFVISLSACVNKKTDESNIIKSMEESLVKSNNTINRFTQTNLRELQEKTTEWSTSERAKVWFPKAEQIAVFTKIRLDFIETKKSKEKLNATDLKEIYSNLMEYEKEVLGRDSTLREEFKNSFYFIENFIGLISSDTSINSINLKNSISNQYLKAAITSLQNELRIIENKTIAYCNYKVGSTIGYFDTYSVIVGQNSKYLKSGDYLEIIAGVGAFSKSSKPKIVINGKEIEIGEEGYSSYKMKVYKTPGNYRTPVKIKYFNQITGKEEIREIFVEYTVAKPCDQ